MIASLREAKARLSELVAKARGGEDTVITVRGKPCARLVGIAAGAEPDMAAWRDELRKRHAAVTAGRRVRSAAKIVADLREERADR